MINSAASRGAPKCNYRKCDAVSCCDITGAGKPYLPSYIAGTLYRDGFPLNNGDHCPLNAGQQNWPVPYTVKADGKPQLGHMFGWPLLIALLLVLFTTCCLAAQDGNRAKTWHVTVTYGNGEVWALDNLAELHFEAESGELVTVDGDGETLTWNLGEKDIARSLVIGWDSK